MATFKKINRSSLVQVVIDRLTDAMIKGELKPGDKIPTEMELAEQLGIARNTVREAVKILVYMGVLEIRRPDGTFVMNGFSDNLIDPMIYGIILNQKNENELQELRAMTEAGVLNNAISKCTDEEVAVLKEKLALLKEAIFAEDQNVDRVFERDNEFHAAITEMGKNVMISKINAMVMLLTNNTRYESVKYMIESKRNQELYEAHEKVYQMVLNREGSELYANIQRTYF
ncbi:MAG TPA: FadR family transcriptional regulator, partial [Lachnospiraceae bacterium]|nr:FadR family transcriptional regulator [Lachnospiraceae bacterium]